MLIVKVFASKGWNQLDQSEMRLVNNKDLEGRKSTARAAYTLAEVLIAVFLLGTLVLALFGAFSAGLGVMQTARENMRATQILMQKLEMVRLYTWNQATNTTLASTNFTERYDPLSTNSGALYAGTYSAVDAPSSVPAAYRSNMRLVTLTVYWTNGIGARTRVHSRQMQTLVARSGMQNYIF